MNIATKFSSVAADELKLRDDWVPDNPRRDCYVCRKTFHVLRRKHHCRVCGEIVCGNCSSVKSLTESPVATITHVKTCLWCPQRTRHARKHSATSASSASVPPSPAELEQLRRRPTLGCSSSNSIVASVDKSRRATCT
ncbi:hypothetical protein DYB30_013682 [Aphanomyces astaci]|uniref:FYVE-type domain-containing protein n=1 Tax=Aphanomyces astaci TaxID=112090 RepID=A0A397E0B6_APHAT|nr:hypothetical protein DYB30_013682 [Aphanomyces astaci]